MSIGHMDLNPTSPLELEQQAVRLQATVYHRPIPFAKAVTIESGGKYGIFLDSQQIDTQGEYRQILCHELGHCATGTTHGPASPWDLVARHEERANRWAYERLLPPDAIRQALCQGEQTLWQLSEYFSLPQEFVQHALDYYTNAKGIRF